MSRLRTLLARWSETNYAVFALATYARELLRGPDEPPLRPDFPGREAYLRDYTKWQALRSRVLARDEKRLRELVLANTAAVVHGGPFEGMATRSCEGRLPAAQVLGSFESELHASIEGCIARGYDRLINVGCSCGYYAVGMALRMPGLEVHAFDLDPEARSACQRLATENLVADRINLGGRFEGPEFAALGGPRTLVICDIEGGELDVLDPERHPTLREMDVIVELHDALRLDTSSTICRRFEASHEIRLITEGEHPFVEPPAWLRSLGAVERFIACYGGGRSGPTSWGVMTAASDPPR